MDVIRPRRPAGSRHGGRFAPGASQAPDALAGASGAISAEFDGLVARLASTVGPWEEHHSGLGRTFVSRGCSTEIGPFAEGGTVTMTVWGGDSGWHADAAIDGPPRRHRQVLSPDGAGAFDDPDEALAALEAVLRSAPEAENLIVLRRHIDPDPSLRTDFCAAWDWAGQQWRSL